MTPSYTRIERRWAPATDLVRVPTARAVMADRRYQTRTPNAKLALLHAILLYMNEEGVWWPRHATWATSIGVAADTMPRIVRELDDSGLVARHLTGRANTYRLDPVLITDNRRVSASAKAEAAETPRPIEEGGNRRRTRSEAGDAAASREGVGTEGEPRAPQPDPQRPLDDPDFLPPPRAAGEVPIEEILRMFPDLRRDLGPVGQSERPSPGDPSPPDEDRGTEPAS